MVNAIPAAALALNDGAAAFVSASRRECGLWHVVLEVIRADGGVDGMEVSGAHFITEPEAARAGIDALEAEARS